MLFEVEKCAVGAFFRFFMFLLEKKVEKFFCVDFFSLICNANINKKNNTKMDKFTSYIGVLLIAVGAIMLLVSYFSANLMDTNWFDALGIGIMIVGLFVHAFKIAKAV